MSFGIEVTNYPSGDPNSRAGRAVTVKKTGEKGVIAEPANGGLNGPQMNVDVNRPQLTTWVFFEDTGEFRLYTETALHVDA